jgi:hypothetical protein
MSLKEINFKQFLLTRGERVGLFVALGVLVLMVGLLFVPPLLGFLSAGPEDNAKSLKADADAVARQIDSPSNKPVNPGDLPQNAEEKLVAFEFRRVNGDRYELASLGPSSSVGQVGRRMPRVFGIEEAIVGVNHVNLRTHILDNKSGRWKIIVLKDKEADPDAKPGKPTGKNPYAEMARQMKGKGRPPGFNPMGMPGMMVGKGNKMRPPPNMGMPWQTTADAGKARKEGVPKDLDKTTNADHLARQAEPVRLAVIAASFPFKRELQEFQSKLGLGSLDEVVGELSEERVGKDKKRPPSFRFLGVEVQRRELDEAGNPLSDWPKDERGNPELLPLPAQFRYWLFLAGSQKEADPPLLRQVSYPGLVMSRIKEFHEKERSTGGPGGFGPSGGVIPPEMMKEKEADSGEEQAPSAYPAVEEKMPLLSRTLALLQEKVGKAEVAKLGQFDTDALDAFGATQVGSEEKEEGDEGKEKDVKPAEKTWPDYCLVRVIDLNLEPGKTYEYRMRIAMANPNLFRPIGGGAGGVATPDYASKAKFPRLLSKWSDELQYYELRGDTNDATKLAEPVVSALRKKKVPDEVLAKLNALRSLPQERERKKYTDKGQFLTDLEQVLGKADLTKYQAAILQAALQLRIVVRVEPELKYYVTGWAGKIRNRLPRSAIEEKTPRALRQGEVVLEAHRWVDSLNLRGKGAELRVGDWVVSEGFPVSRGEYVGRREHAEVPFWSYDREATVLAIDTSTTKLAPGIDVNFGAQSGDVMVDADNGTGHTYARADKVAAREATGSEAVILSPDGQLRVLESAVDANNKDRLDRKEKVRKRVKAVRDRTGGSEKKKGGKEKDFGFDKS